MSELIWFNGETIPMSDARPGVEDRGSQFADGVYEVAAGDVDWLFVPLEAAAKMRASFILLGPLLSRFGRVMARDQGPGPARDEIRGSARDLPLCQGRQSRSTLRAEVVVMSGTDAIWAPSMRRK